LRGVACSNYKFDLSLRTEFRTVIAAWEQTVPQDTSAECDLFVNHAKERKIMIEGSCLCGGVHYEYAGDFGTITVCHCSDCRKAQGASCVAAPVDAAQLRWIRGTELLCEYESSPGKKRAFCSRCGSPLYSRRESEPQVLRLRMGTIDTPMDATPVAHIFVAGLPPWAALDDDLPRYEKLEPGRG
jgi:hypothetical protein